MAEIVASVITSFVENRNFTAKSRVSFNRTLPQELSVRLKLKRVRSRADTRVEWTIKGGMNDGTSGQDYDGDHYIDEELEAKTAEEALRLFEAKVEELKQATRSDGERKYVKINVALKMRSGESRKTVREVSLSFEKCIREDTITIKPGRGWIESKKWLNLKGNTKLKNGNTRRKYVKSQS